MSSSKQTQTHQPPGRAREARVEHVRLVGVVAEEPLGGGPRGGRAGIGLERGREEHVVQVGGVDAHEGLPHRLHHLRPPAILAE